MVKIDILPLYIRITRQTVKLFFRIPREGGDIGLFITPVPKVS